MTEGLSMAQEDNRNSLLAFFSCLLIGLLIQYFNVLTFLYDSCAFLDQQFTFGNSGDYLDHEAKETLLRLITSY